MFFTSHHLHNLRKMYCAFPIRSQSVQSMRYSSVNGSTEMTFNFETNRQISQSQNTDEQQ